MSEDLMDNKAVLRGSSLSRQFSADSKNDGGKYGRSISSGFPGPRSANFKAANAVSVSAPKSKPHCGNVKRPPPKRAEWGSAQRQGCKKRQWNEHQMRWDYGVKDGATNLGSRHPFIPWALKTNQYNKEQFVQAMCQFVVLEGEDYSAFLKNSDLCMEWDSIQQMCLIDEDVSTCPICLYPPKAAQITKCGHVFCWPCILHYLALSDKPWRKCPICYESLYKNQLKSVIARSERKYAVGDEVTLFLMKRDPSQMVAFPQGQWRTVSKPLDAKDTSSCWCKVVTMSPAEVCRDVCDRELQELTLELEELGLEPEKVFVEAAIDALKERKKNLEELCTKDLVLEQPASAQPALLETSVQIHDEAKFVEYSDAFNEKVQSVRDKIHPATTDNLETTLEEDKEELIDPVFGQTLESNSMEILDPSSYYYFYQSETGQNLFLHPLNARMLMAEFGSLAYAPPQISGKIIEVERWSMDTEARRRFKPLAHLPITTSFQLAEIKFDRGFVSRSTLNSFSDELYRRRQLRQRRAREEKRQERKAEHWHQSVMIQSRGYSCPSGLDVMNSEREIPFFKHVPSAQGDIDALQADVGGPMPSETLMSSSPTPSEDTCLSFAQMLRMGRRKAENPDLPSAMSPHPEEVGSSQLVTEVDPEESLPAPSWKDTFGQAVAAAFDNFSTAAQEDGGSGEGEPESGRKNKKGKKKMKGKVLFSI